MRGILPLLQDNCSSLRSLYYRKPGRLMSYRNIDGQQDEHCYEELAQFASSVAPTLESFSFKQGCSSSHTPFAQSATTRYYPMDGRFVKHVIPALMQTTWPSLEALSIAIDDGPDPIGKPTLHTGTKPQLEEHLGNNVQIHYKRKAERPCEEFLGLTVFIDGMTSYK